MKRFPGWLLFAAGLLAVSGSACEGGGGQPSTGLYRVARRLLGDDDPRLLLARRDLGAKEVRFAWSFRRRSDLDGWRVAYGQARQEEDGLAVSYPTSSRAPHLIRQVELESGALDGLEIDVTSMDRGPIRLCWAPPGEPFIAERTITLHTEGGGSSVETLSFDLTGHPRWAGRISRLRLDPVLRRGAAVRLHEIRGFKRHISDELAAAVARPWHQPLASDLRHALAAPPGLPVIRRAELPRGAALRFAYGLESGMRAAVTFSVSLEEEGRERKRIFSADLAPGAGEKGWQTAEVDLSAYAGRRVSLVFETAAGEPLDLAGPLPLWANLEILAPAPEERPPNILLISVDTLRPDHLSLYGHHRQTSPHLDRWARRAGVVFDQAVAAAPWTLPSHVSLFTGLDALSHGVNHPATAPEDLTTLAEILRRQGFVTLGVTGSGFLSPGYGLGQGFDEWRSWPHPVAERDDEMEHGVEQVLEWLSRERRRPFFLFFHTYEVHEPYRRREPYFRRFTGGRFGGAPSSHSALRTERNAVRAEEGFLGWRTLVVRKSPSGSWSPLPDQLLPLAAALYDSGVAYADAQLGRIFAALEASGLDRETIVAFTSDHGEALGEKGLAAHAYLYDLNVLVPLVIALPDRRGAGRRIASQVRSVDVLPTLLDAAGLTVPPGLDGVSLLPLIEGAPREGPGPAWSYAPLTNRGLSLRLDNRVKYIYNNTAWPPLAGEESLYRIDRDPGEDEDRAGSLDTAGLRRRVLERLEEEPPALRIDLANAGDGGGRLTGTIAGSPVRPSTVKAALLPCPCLTWIEPHRAAFQVPPSASLSLRFEDVGSAVLEITGALTDPDAADFRLLIDPGALTDARGMVLEGARWRETEEPLAPDQTGVVARWQGPPRRQSGDPAELDPGLRRALRALGYL